VNLSDLQVLSVGRLQVLSVIKNVTNKIFKKCLISAIYNIKIPFLFYIPFAYIMVFYTKGVLFHLPFCFKGAPPQSDFQPTSSPAKGLLTFHDFPKHLDEMGTRFTWKSYAPWWGDEVELTLYICKNHALLKRECERCFV